MHICILHIGHTEPGEKPKHPPSPERFRQAIAKHIPTARWTTISAVLDELPEPDDYDAYLITGGKYSVFEQVEWQDRLIAFIKVLVEQRIPLIGVCYGHQAIAQALGAKVERSQKGFGVGLMPVQVTLDTTWCHKSSDPLMLHAMHQDQVVELPKDARLFLTSDFCPISGYTIGNHVFAIQQHPDFTKALNLDLITKRKDRISKAMRDQALVSLEGRDDTETSAIWMADFLVSAMAQEPA